MGASDQLAADGYQYCGEEMSLIKTETCADGEGKETERVQTLQPNKLKKYTVTITNCKRSQDVSPNTAIIRSPNTPENELSLCDITTYIQSFHDCSDQASRLSELIRQQTETVVFSV